MKRTSKLLIAMLLTVLTLSGTAMAATQSFAVYIFSTPLASNGHTGNSGGVLNTSIGSTVDFTRVIEAQGVVNNSWEWNFDSNYLDCAAYPEFDSDTLRCEVIAEGSTGVNIHMSPQMEDGSTWDHTSNTIQLEMGGNLPPKISYDHFSLLEFDDTNYSSPFPDLGLSTLVGKAATELWRRDIISGYPDGEFKASNEVNRAEAAKFLVNSKHGGPLSNISVKNFSDVAAFSWFAAYVMTAYSENVIQGYADGTFRPGNQINTAEFMKMITLTFNLPLNIPHNYKDVSSDAWFSAYAGAAQVYNLFPLRASDYLEAGKLMSREEVAIAIYQYYKYEWDIITTVQ